MYGSEKVKVVLDQCIVFTRILLTLILPKLLLFFFLFKFSTT